MKKNYFVFVLCVSITLYACDDFSDVSGVNTLENVSTSSLQVQVTPPILKGTYDDFLTAVRTFESSIDPKQAAYYAENYNNPNAIKYSQVEYPGRVIRDYKTGKPLSSITSIKGYFKKIGVDHLYDPKSTDPNMFKLMQYSVTNYLGFIGYQFSEQDLHDLGYYNYHKDAQGLPEYYSDIPVSNWAGGVRNKVMGNVDITDVNRWKGTFTGKHGIYTMQDFKDPKKQDFIAKDHFKFKHDNIVKFLAERGKKLEDYLGTKLYWSTLKPVFILPVGRSDAVTVTMSGLLAGAHLRGAKGVVELLVDHKNPEDENHTAILQYVQDYGNYDTPWDKNVRLKY